MSLSERDVRGPEEHEIVVDFGVADCDLIPLTN
jgi:hypothetical protein